MIYWSRLFLVFLLNLSQMNQADKHAISVLLAEEHLYMKINRIILTISL